MLATRPDFRRARESALTILKRNRIISPPVNPVELARELGVEVYFAEFSSNMEEVSGFYDADENAIYVNSDEYPLRQTFTVAHELGHKILHAEWAKSNDYRVLMRDQAANSDSPQEKEANTFAANLLVPRFMLDDYYGLAKTTELSKLFAVSIPVIENRIKFEYGA